MDNFNNTPQHNDSGAIEDAARKNRIQQLKLEMLKTTEPDKLAKLQEMLDQEEAAAQKSKLFSVFAFVFIGIVFLFILFQFLHMGGIS